MTGDQDIAQEEDGRRKHALLVARLSGEVWICHAVLPLDEGQSFSEDGLFTARAAAVGVSSDECCDLDPAVTNIDPRTCVC